MKDTIGAHMAEARRCSMSAALWLAHAKTRRHDSISQKGAMILSAEHEGAAAGHAFRAAELAYDMGINHGIWDSRYWREI